MSLAVENFCVVIALQNHMQLEYMRDVVLNCLHAIKEKLQFLPNELWRYVRVRYYRGQESACLLNYLPHDDIRRYFGDDTKPCVAKCLKCPLYIEYRKIWDCLPADVPYLDDDVLVGAGFCPFKALFHRSFYYKSVVLIPYDLLGLVTKQLRRFKVRRVVVIIDEYLDAMMRRIDIPLTIRCDVKLESGEEQGVVDEYVDVLRRFVSDLEFVVNEIYGAVVPAIVGLGYLSDGIEIDPFGFGESSFSSSRIVELLSGYRDEFMEKYMRARSVCRALALRGDYRNYSRLRALLRVFESLYDDCDMSFDKVGSWIFERDVFLKRNDVREDVKCRFVLIYGRGRRCLMFGVGSWLRSSLYALVKSARSCVCDVYVFLVSSMNYSWEMKLPGRVYCKEYMLERDMPQRVALDDIVEVLRFEDLPRVGLFSVDELKLKCVEDALRESRNIWDVYVVSKDIMFRIVKRIFGSVPEVRSVSRFITSGDVIEVHGDSERCVIDYVAFPRRRLIFLVGFGRCAKGVDVPVPRDEPVRVTFISSMRFMPTIYVPPELVEKAPVGMSEFGGWVGDVIYCGCGTFIVLERTEGRCVSVHALSV